MLIDRYLDIYPPFISMVRMHLWQVVLTAVLMHGSHSSSPPVKAYLDINIIYNIYTISTQHIYNIYTLSTRSLLLLADVHAADGAAETREVETLAAAQRDLLTREKIFFIKIFAPLPAHSSSPCGSPRTWAVCRPPPRRPHHLPPGEPSSPPGAPPGSCVGQD